MKLVFSESDYGKITKISARRTQTFDTSDDLLAIESEHRDARESLFLIDFNFMVVISEDNGKVIDVIIASFTFFQTAARTVPLSHCGYQIGKLYQRWVNCRGELSRWDFS